MGEKKRRAAAGLIKSEGNAKAARLLRDARQFLRSGQLRDAKMAFERVLQLVPTEVGALVGLAEVARKVGQASAAVNILATAVELAPLDSESRQQFALALEAVGEFEAATREWEALCAQHPQNCDFWENLGLSRQFIGKIPEAESAYAMALELAPSMALRCKMATLISPIVMSIESMLLERQKMDQTLDAILAMGDKEPVIEDPMAAALWTNFYLAYHGKLNKALQVKTASMYRAAIPSLEFVSDHCLKPRPAKGKIRIGLISQFFYNHSIGRTSRGFFSELSRENFDVWAIFIGPTVDDDYSRFIRQHADHSVVVPQDLKSARAAIAAAELDILFFQDIGMEPFSYFLAYSRLAPLQCVSFGHPDTTGIPTIDYFISNDLYETGEAQDHYSEKLHLLSNVGTLAYYDRPQLPVQHKSRTDFGFSTADHIYLCPQNLFKIHPEMDALLGAILRNDLRGKVVMVCAKISHWTEMLRARWRESIPDVADRVIFLPRMGSADYLSLIAASEVMLDTVHFNGMNTSLEAFSQGTPVVTWPGEFQRGRHTQAMYRKMGIAECIANSAQAYVDIALRIANDTAYRASLHARILERCDCLFQERRVIAEFERSFIELLKRP
jgi:predicted O-linked N-acetylglucosamine transferase (SPINDLY family)